VRKDEEEKQIDERQEKKINRDWVGGLIGGQVGDGLGWRWEVGFGGVG